jgi:cyclase
LLAHYAEECFIPLAYGGGLETVDDVGRILRIGYEKVVLNTALHERPEMVRDAVSRYGSQAIVAAVDVRRVDGGNEVFVRGATVGTGVDAVTFARSAEALGCGEVLLTAVDREGTMGGFDLELSECVAAAVGVPVIAHGGAGKRKELGGPVKIAGCSAVAAGSLFVYPSRAQIRKLMS